MMSQFSLYANMMLVYHTGGKTNYPSAGYWGLIYVIYLMTAKEGVGELGQIFITDNGFCHE